MAEKQSLVQHRRKTFANAITRERHFTLSDKFTVLSSIELNERMEFLKNHYCEFTKEHQMFVTNVSQNQFAEQDRYFSEMTEVYQDAILAYRQQIVKTETNELLRKSEEKRSDNQFTISKMQPMNERLNVMQINKRKCSQNESSKEAEKLHWKKRARQEENVVNHQFNRERLQTGGMRSVAVVSKQYKFKLSENDLRHKIAENVKPNRISCNFCNGNHKVFDCTVLRNLSLTDRSKRIRAANLCQNCLMDLGDRFNSHRCKSSYCRKCGVWTIRIS